MYSEKNFQTKKALKEAIENGEKIGIFQPNDMFNNPKASPTFTGTAYLEGPHYPQPHKWYAEVELNNGIIIKVK